MLLTLLLSLLLPSLLLSVPSLLRAAVTNVLPLPCTTEQQRKQSLVTA